MQRVDVQAAHSRNTNEEARNGSAVAGPVLQAPNGEDVRYSMPSLPNSPVRSVCERTYGHQFTRRSDEISFRNPPRSA